MAKPLFNLLKSKWRSPASRLTQHDGHGSKDGTAQGVDQPVGGAVQHRRVERQEGVPAPHQEGEDDGGRQNGSPEFQDVPVTART